MPVIPGTQQEEIKRISAKKLKNPISKKYSSQKSAGGVAQV
jgi:hypothetical protein